MPESVPTILVAEDDHADVLLLETAAARAKIGSSLHVVGDGQEALEYLGAKDQPMPYLVILDLNMPRMDGKRAIHEIRANESTRHLPVVVMSTSSATADVQECLALGLRQARTQTAQSGSDRRSRVAAVLAGTVRHR